MPSALLKKDTLPAAEKVWWLVDVGLVRGRVQKCGSRTLAPMMEARGFKLSARFCFCFPYSSLATQQLLPPRDEEDDVGSVT
jgi:hypothetical protein